MDDLKVYLENENDQREVVDFINLIILKQTFVPGIQIQKILVVGECGLMELMNPFGID